MAVNVTWMKKGFNAFLSNLYPSVFNHFPVIQPVSSKVRHFSTFLTFCLLLDTPSSGIIAVNVTWMEREFNAGQTHSSIYPSIFNRLRAIARYWSEIATFSYPLAFSAPVGGDPLGRSSWFLVGDLPDGQATIWCKNISEKLNPLSRMNARHRRDRQIKDRRICHAIQEHMNNIV